MAYTEWYMNERRKLSPEASEYLVEVLGMPPMDECPYCEGRGYSYGEPCDTCYTWAEIVNELTARLARIDQDLERK